MNQTLKLLPKAVIRLKLFATKAAPSPVLGQSLGQYGINIMDFCKKFNNQTRNLKEEVLVSVVVKIYSQKNYDIEIKTPSSSDILKKIINLPSDFPLKDLNTNQGSFLFLKEIYHLAVFKKCDILLNHLQIKSICKSLIGTAKSMNIVKFYR